MRETFILSSLILLFAAANVFASSVGSPQAISTASQWENLEPEGDFWPERWDFQLVSHDDKMLVIGGQNTTGYLNDIWTSRDGRQWQQLPQPGWSPRAYFQVVEFAGALFLIGGETAQGMSNEVWASRDKGRNWQQVETGSDHFGPRRLHQVLVLNGQLVLLGGENGAHEQYSDIWLSDDGATWRRVEVDGKQWGQRKYFRAIAEKGSVLVLGGLDPAKQNKAFISEDLLNWRAFRPEGEFWGERMFFSSTVMDDGLVWFIGGGSTPLGSEANDILIAALGGSWLLIQPERHFDRRGHHEAVMHEGKFYLMGGKREDAIEKVAHRDIWVRVK